MSRSTNSSRSLLHMTRHAERQQRASRSTTLLLLALGVTAGVALVMAFSRRQRAGSRGLTRGRSTTAAVRSRPLHLVAGAQAPARSSAPIDPLEVLEGRVLDVFRNDPILRERAIDIGAVGDGGIELTGWVDAPAEVAHAVTVTRGVPGVTRVVDHLAVRGRETPRNHSSGNYAAVREARTGDNETSAPPRAD